jgi:hypothetical protein
MAGLPRTADGATGTNDTFACKQDSVQPASAVSLIKAAVAERVLMLYCQISCYAVLHD